MCKRWPAEGLLSADAAKVAERGGSCDGDNDTPSKTEPKNETIEHLPDSPLPAEVVAAHSVTDHQVSENSNDHRNKTVPG